MSNLAKAIKSLKPNAEFSYQNEDYSTVNWIVLDGEAPTQEQIDNEISRLQIEEKAEAENYSERRAKLLEKLGLTEEEAKLLLG